MGHGTLIYSKAATVSRGRDEGRRESTVVDYSVVLYSPSQDSSARDVRI
jgi:hypothetical protein